MSFQHPWLLLLVLLVPALTWVRHARRRLPALTFSDTAILRQIPVAWTVRLQPLLPFLYAAGLTLLVLALARPREGLDESDVTTEAVDIVLLVDVSTSMRAIDFSTNTRQLDRLEAAKEVIRTFVEKRPQDRLGMVVFAALPYTLAPLTIDHGWLLLRLGDAQTGMLEDGTAIGTGLASAVNRLRDSKAKSKVVILLTDGINNAGDLSPANAAAAAKALGIRVYTVGAGATGIVLMPVQDPFGGTQYVRQRSDIDETTLRHIADTTGGKYFRATDLDSLKRVYDEIDSLEKTEIEVHQYTRYKERFMPFVLTGLICLASERLLSLSRLGRFPS